MIQITTLSRTIATAAVILACTPVSAHGMQEESNMACVVRMPMPSYAELARVGNSSGSVTTTITLGRDGVVDSVSFKALSQPQNVKVFSPFINRAMKASKFDPQCAGRAVVINFVFKIGTADRVSFGYPNTFEIEAKLPLINTQRTR